MGVDRVLDPFELERAVVFAVREGEVGIAHRAAVHGDHVSSVVGGGWGGGLETAGVRKGGTGARARAWGFGAQDEISCNKRYGGGGIRG